MIAEPVAVGDVAIVKLALADPAGTVTLAGNVAIGEPSFLSATTTPPGGAADVSRTVPVAEAPWITSFGTMVTEDSVGEDDGGGVLAVQPDRRALVAVAEPSLTSTVQSAGAVNGSRWMRNPPAPSLVPIATPSTVIVRLAIAVPSIFSCVPPISARETLTAPSAPAGKTKAAITARRPRSASRKCRRPLTRAGACAASGRAIARRGTRTGLMRRHLGKGLPAAAPRGLPARRGHR